MTCVSSPRFLVGLLFLTLMWVTPLRAESFTGNYHGISAAAGMSLSLQEAKGRLVGRLAAADGRIYALNGTVADSTKSKKVTHSAQGELRLTGVAKAVAFFRIEARPLGIQFLFIPVFDSGAPNMPAAHDYSFLAQGVKIKATETFLPAPRAGGKVDVLDFIDKYRQWSPRDVARLYSSLSDKDRGLIELYDHASGDILWRVCTTNPPNDVVSSQMLSELLDRQHITCAELMPLAERAEKGGLFPEFLRRARFQFEIIRETILCDRGKSSPNKCADVSALGAPLIVNWRELRSIFNDLLPEELVVTQPLDEPATASAPDATQTVEPQGARIPLPPLRASIVDVPEVAAPSAPVARSKAEKAKEGRFIATERRRDHPLPLSDPRN